MGMSSDSNGSARRTMGVSLIALSFLLWVALPGIPFLTASLAEKGVIAGGFLAGAELTFWAGLLLLGPEISERIRSWLPALWARRGTNLAATREPSEP